MIHYSLADEERVVGQNEDGPVHGLIYFLVATAEDGKRWIGPLLSPEQVEFYKGLSSAQTNEQMAGIDPATSDEWQPWFPVYGSTAYESSGQEALNRHCERNDMPYHPAF